MSSAPPILALCVPGPWRAAPAIETGAEVALAWQERDPDLVEVFAASACPYRASLDHAALRAVARHASVLYARGPAGSPEAAAAMVQVGRALLDAGGLAVRCVSSGIASSAVRWRALEAELDTATRELATGAGEAAYARHQALADAYVQLPIEDAEGYGTSGLHLLGFPEVRVARAAAVRAFGAEAASRGEQIADLLELFALYLAVEAGDRLQEGQTFATAVGAPRFALHHRPSTRVAPDDLAFAPRGVWILDDPA